MLIDLTSILLVQLVDPTQILSNADDDTLVMGATLAMVGDELIQFGRAELIAPGQYRLSRLLRGRRGSEWAIGGHGADESFCLIGAAALRPIEVARGSIGATLEAVARGVADAEPLPRAERILSGETLRPPSPCHLKLARNATGLDLAWTRRSHRGWSWIDGDDVPADAFAERYRVVVTGPGGQRTIETGNLTLSVADTDIPASGGQQIGITVQMLGPFAASRAIGANLTL